MIFRICWTKISTGITLIISYAIHTNNGNGHDRAKRMLTPSVILWVNLFNCKYKSYNDDGQNRMIISPLPINKICSFVSKSIDTKKRFIEKLMKMSKTRINHNSRVCFD